MATTLGLVAAPWDDSVSLLSATNSLSTGTLNAPLLTDSGATITVDVSGGNSTKGGYPATNGAISLQDEIVYYATYSASAGTGTFSGCVRAQDGTSTITHSAGTVVSGYEVRAHRSLLRDALIQTQGILRGNNNGPLWYNICAPPYGAVPNYASAASGASISATSTTVAISNTTFNNSDVGKRYEITGAGTAGATYVGTIVSITDPTHAVLSVAAGTTVINQAWAYGTDSTAAIQSAINACPTGGTVYSPVGNFWTGQLHINKKIRFVGHDVDGNTAFYAIAGATGPLFDVAIAAGVIEVDIVTPGTGYVAGASLTFTGGGGSGAVGTIATVDGSGGITALSLTNTGFNYTNAPTVTAPTGTGATFNAILGSTAGLEVGNFNVVMGSNAITGFSVRWIGSSYFHNIDIFNGTRGFEFISVQSSNMVGLGVVDVTDRGFFVNGEHGASLTFRDCNVGVLNNSITMQCGWEFWRNTWLDYGGFGIDNCSVTRNGGHIVNGWKLTASVANTVFAFGAMGLTSDNIDSGDSFVATNAVHVQLRGCWIGGAGGSSVVIDGGYNWIVKDCELFPLTNKGAVEFRGTLTGNAYTIITNNQINSGYCILMPASGTNPYGLIVDGNVLQFSQGISNNNTALSAACGQDTRLGQTIMVNSSGSGVQTFQLLDGASGWAKSFLVDGGGNLQIRNNAFTPILYLGDGGQLYLRATGTAFGTTFTDGLLLQNVNAATSGAQTQQSTSLHWTAHGWNGSADVTLDARETLLLTSPGSASVGQKLGWGFSAAGGAYTEAAALNPIGLALSGGALSAPSYALHTLGGGVRVQRVTRPTLPTVTATGTTGSTTYSYYIVAIDRAGYKTRASVTRTITNGNATLSGANYNALSWVLPPGAVSVDVIRSAGGATQGSIALATTATTLNDTGLAASAYTAPIRETTGDLTVDGSLLTSRFVGTPWYDCTAYGAKADLKSGTDGAITALTPNFIATTSPFTDTATDGGKRIEVAGAGAGGALLVATILSVTDANHATLSTNAGTTVGPTASYTFGTDSTTGIQNAIGDAPAGASVYLPYGTFWTNQININKKINFVGADNHGNTVIQAVSGATGPLINVMKPETLGVIDIVTGGSGYTVGGNLVFTGGDGTGAAGTFTVSGGAVNSVTITNYGGGYTIPPTASAPGGTVGATFNVLLGATPGLECGNFNVVMGTNAIKALSIRFISSSYVHDIVVFGGTYAYEIISVQSTNFINCGGVNQSDHGFFVNGEHGASQTYRDCNIGVTDSSITLQCGFEFWRNTTPDFGGFGIDNCSVTRNAGHAVNGWKLTASQANTVFAFGAAGLTSDNIDLGDSFVATNAVHVQLRGCWIGGAGGSSIVADGGYNWIIADCELFPLGTKGCVEFRGTLTGNAYTIVRNNIVNSGYLFLMPTSGTQPTGLIHHDNETAFAAGITNSFTNLSAASTVQTYRSGITVINNAVTVGRPSALVLMEGTSGFSKSLRTNNLGNLEIINDAFSLALVSITDEGLVALSADSSGFGANYKDALQLQSFAATNAGSTVQWSPAMKLIGQAWDTGATASREADAHLVLKPISGNPISGALSLAFAFNAGAWTESATFTPIGLALAGGGLTQPSYALHTLGAGARVQALATPAAATTTTSTTGGTLAAGTYLYWIVAEDRAGNRTLNGPSVSQVTTGTTSTVTVTPAAVPAAVKYYVLRKATAPTIGGTESILVGSSTGAAVVDTGAALTSFTNAARNNTADLTVDGNALLSAMANPAEHVAFIATANKASTTTAQTVSMIGTGVGTMTLPANFLVPGRSVRLRARGYLTTGSTAGTLTWLFQIGGTTIVSTPALGPATLITGLYWECEVLATCRTIGTSGTVIAQGRVFISTSTSAAAIWGMVETAASTVDTTASKLVDLQLTTSNALHTITCTNVDLTVLN